MTIVVQPRPHFFQWSVLLSNRQKTDFSPLMYLRVTLILPSQGALTFPRAIAAPGQIRIRIPPGFCSKTKQSHIQKISFFGVREPSEIVSIIALWNQIIFYCIRLDQIIVLGKESFCIPVKLTWINPRASICGSRRRAALGGRTNAPADTPSA